MGELYCKSCSNCDALQNVTFDGFVGGLITDDAATGEIITADYLVYLKSPDEQVVLPHPIETSILNDAGGSWNDAMLHGKILQISNLICHDCGAMNATARLHTSGLGCTSGLFAAAVAIVMNVFVFDLHSALEYALVWIALIAPTFMADRYVQFRHENNAAPHLFRTCVNCGGTNALPLSASGNAQLPCVECGKESVTITLAGKS